MQYCSAITARTTCLLLRKAEDSGACAHCTDRKDWQFNMSDHYSKWHKYILWFPGPMHSDLQVTSISRQAALSTCIVKCSAEINRKQFGSHSNLLLLRTLYHRILLLLIHLNTGHFLPPLQKRWTNYKERSKTTSRTTKSFSYTLSKTAKSSLKMIV
jgi:hypothetical protein